MSLQEVFHASQLQGLATIQPNVSSHNRPWVYATKDLVIAAAFLSTTGGDFTCAVGRDEASNKIFICERFPGAFDLRYAGVKGSIYVLPGEPFVEGKTQWEEEVVAEGTVRPLREIPVADAREFLLGLVSTGQLRLCYHPEKIAHIPTDDEDLVFRAAIWHAQFGEKILAQVQQYHPALLARVQQAIADKRYTP